MYTATELRAVFGKPVEPKIRLNLPEITLVAQHSAGKLSISGVQPKLSVRLEGDELVAASEGGRFILKPQTAAFPQLPENEYLCMQMAAQCGIRTAPILPCVGGVCTDLTTTTGAAPNKRLSISIRFCVSLISRHVVCRPSGCGSFHSFIDSHSTGIR